MQRPPTKHTVYKRQAVRREQQLQEQQVHVMHHPQFCVKDSTKLPPLTHTPLSNPPSVLIGLSGRILPVGKDVIFTNQKNFK